MAAFVSVSPTFMGKDNFEQVLNFWCDTPWWWNDNLAIQLQMGAEPRDDLKDK